MTLNDFHCSTLSINILMMISATDCCTGFAIFRMIFVHITSSLDRVRVDFPTTLRASQGHNSINLEHFKHRQKYIYLHKLLIAWLPHDHGTLWDTGLVVSEYYMCCVEPVS